MAAALSAMAAAAAAPGGRRALLGLGHLTHGPAEEELADAHAADNTLDLRVAAIFVIAAAALLCGLPPLFLRAFQSADEAPARVARAFSGGLILALALVHIVPEAVAELGEVVDFPIGGVAVLCGVLVLVALDSLLSVICSARDARAAAGAAAGAADGGRAHEEEGAAAAAATGKDAAAVTALGIPAGETTAAARATAAAAHGHQCMSRLTASGAGPAGWLSVRARVTAYTMELGCIFHSVVIGVGVGVITGDRQLVAVLMIALAVHQGLEGLSLGSVLALAPFSRLKKVLMVCAYAITTSVGIAIGVAASATYDPDSAASRAVQGALNGVSGGMLLYVSIYTLIAEEFSRADLAARWRLRAAMIAALLLGAACMCVLAIWS